MEIKKKSLLTGSLIAGALFATTSFTANASDLFRFEHLGSADAVRTNLLPSNANTSNTLELTCGKGKSDSTMKKGKDGKCGEGKCGEGKKKKSSTKKG